MNTRMKPANEVIRRLSKAAKTMLPKALPRLFLCGANVKPGSAGFRHISFAPPPKTPGGERWEGGVCVLISRMAVALRPWNLAFLQCRDGARRVFADQAKTARGGYFEAVPSPSRRPLFLPVFLLRNAREFFFHGMHALHHGNRFFRALLTLQVDRQNLVMKENRRRVFGKQ